jgi:hypothetical protein
MRSQLSALGFVESSPKHHCMPWAASLTVCHIIFIISIMMKSFLDHFCSRRCCNLCHIVIVDIDGDSSRREDFRFDGCMAALRKLAHDISADVLIRYLLLTIQRN